MRNGQCQRYIVINFCVSNQVIELKMAQYVGSELGSYPMWDSSVLYQAPPPSHPHVTDHALYRQPCALLHQRLDFFINNLQIRNSRQLVSVLII